MSHNEISYNSLQLISSSVFNAVEKLNLLSDKEKPYFPLSGEIGFCDVSQYSVKITLYPKMDRLHREILDILKPFFKKDCLYIGICQQQTFYFAFEIRSNN